MRTRFASLVARGLLVCSAAACLQGVGPVRETAGRPMDESRDNRPLAFEPCYKINCGPMGSRFRFLARSQEWTAWLGPAEAILAFRLPRREKAPPREGLASWPFAFSMIASSGMKEYSAAAQNSKPTTLGVRFSGANPSAAAMGLQDLPGKSNYFIGSDPASWRADIPTYSRLVFREVYPNIDVIYYGNQGRLEYDFELKPGASVSAIQMEFEGADKVEVLTQGDLGIHLWGREAFLRKPIAYQKLGKGQVPVAARYVERAPNRFGIELGTYDTTKPVLIDPILEVATYAGGNTTDESGGVGIDGLGNIYLTGSTVSANFPTTPGAFLTDCRGCPNFPVVFVTKLNPTGSAVLYSTFIGGRVSTDNPAHGTAIVVDTAGNAYITGDTSTFDFPTTNGAFRSTISAASATFVTKLAASGAIVYSTFLGPSGTGSEIAIDTLGNAYIAGSTSATDFPTTPGVFQGTRAGTMPDFDAFVAKLNPAGSALVYATYLGGSGLDLARAIAVDPAGNVYVTGETSSIDFPTTSGTLQRVYGGNGGCCFGAGDAFVTKLNPIGSGLVYSTYIGGNQGEIGSGVAVGLQGNAYVTGFTFSANFPTTSESFRSRPQGTGDGFVAQLHPNGSSLVYSTYLGSATGVALPRIAIDSSGSAHISGQTTSRTFPTASPLQSVAGTTGSAFLQKLNSAGSTLIFSTLLGGMTGGERGSGLALDAAGNAYIAGQTSSRDFPTTSNAVQRFSAGGTDVFVAKLSNIRLPVTSLSVTSIPFANQLVGGASAPRRVSVTNDGDAILDFMGITTSGDFRQVNTCGVSLPAGSRCAIDVSFLPVTGGSTSGTLAISGSAAGSPHVVSLTGTGINPVPALVSISPSNVTAGGASVTLSVHGSNFVPSATAPERSGSVVRWNGLDRPTVFVSSGQLTATIYGGDLEKPGEVARVSVFNPEPGGGSSMPLSITIAVPAAPVVNSGGLTNAASFGAQPSPGAIASIFGTDFASVTTVAESSILPNSIGTTSVLVNGLAAPLFFVSPTQINFQMPWEVFSRPELLISVTTAGGTSPEMRFTSAEFSPGVFSMDSTGRGQGAILISPTGEIAGPVGSISGRAVRPARPGEFIAIYCTGLGEVTDRPASGAAAPAARLSATKTAPTVTVGGVNALVSFSGLAPGFVGLYQVNAQIPESAPIGGSVPVIISIGGAISNTVTIALQ